MLSWPVTVCVGISVQKVVNTVIIKKCSTLKYVCVFVLLIFCFVLHTMEVYNTPVTIETGERNILIYIYVLSNVVNSCVSPCKSTMTECSYGAVKSKVDWKYIKYCNSAKMNIITDTEHYHHTILPNFTAKTSCIIYKRVIIFFILVASQQL